MTVINAEFIHFSGQASVSQWSLIFSENFSPPALKFVCPKFYSFMSAKIRFKTKDPLWEDCFSFLVHNPRRQELEVEVKGSPFITGNA